MLDVPAAAGGAAAPDLVPKSEVRAGRTVRLLLSGALDGQRAQTVRRSVADALRRHRPARIDIDLLGCTFVDVAGVRALQLCYADVAQENCRLRFIQASAGTQRILQAAGLVEPATATTAEEPHGA